MTVETFDVLIVGAGISGIGAGYHLLERCPDRSWAIFEARGDLGGTWDLFRYPGVRLDSDMYTLGYRFRPWTDPKAIADGESIRRYLRDTAREFGIDRRIRFGHRLRSADWSGADAMWTVRGERRDGDRVERFEVRCRVLYLCSGYYDYDHGYTPAFRGAASFSGPIVHPQHWPEGLELRDRRVVVIGSGATAVTLVPALADRGARVTMLQRSPTWMLARPSVDRAAQALRRWLPERIAYRLVRAKNIALSQWFFRLSRRRPERVGRALLAMAREALGPAVDVERHFTPRYRPWEQRLCLLPDGDLFRVLRSGTASIVTDTIASFDATGIALASGRHLDADLIVTATGLELKFAGGLALTVDGEPVDPASRLYYKGAMLDGVPNLLLSFGYTNASWTLKSDLSAEFACRLIRAMQRRGATAAVARHDPRDTARRPWVDFSSGYFARAAGRFPQQGTRRPWTLNQNYLRDLLALRYGPIDDGVLEFTGPRSAS